MLIFVNSISIDDNIEYVTKWLKGLSGMPSNSNRKEIKNLKCVT